MKVITVFTLAFVCMSYSCVQESSSPLAGAWELVEGKYISEDTMLTYPMTASSEHMKILSESHFATIWQDTTNPHPAYPGMNGGSYTLVDSLYTEHLDYASNPSVIGTKALCKVKFDGDRFILSPVSEDGQNQEYGFYEEWKRVD
jgi:hypothetical protein